jgi:hypothetical protein
VAKSTVILIVDMPDAHSLRQKNLRTTHQFTLPLRAGNSVISAEARQPAGISVVSE